MDTNLRKHQMVMLDALKELDRICKKHKILYFLFAGTALGAVRHNGFVPWDDDIDIIMPRTEYNRFLAVAEEELDKKYFLQREFSQHWPVFYSKLRVNGTACIEKYYPKDKNMHQGIFVDIFPCDNLSDFRIMRYLQFVASKVVIAKALDKRGYLTDSKFKKFIMFMCRPLSMNFFLKLAKKEKNSNTKCVHSFFAGASKYRKNIFPREWFAKSCDMSFEGENMPVSENYDGMLKVIYGEYMVLPPEEKRKVKHSMLIDTENSYEQYIDYQKQHEITEYTQSSR